MKLKSKKDEFFLKSKIRKQEVKEECWVDEESPGRRDLETDPP